MNKKLIILALLVLAISAHNSSKRTKHHKKSARQNTTDTAANADMGPCDEACADSHGFAGWVQEHAGEDGVLQREEAVGHEEEFDKCVEYADHNGDGQLEYCEILECVYWSDDRVYENNCDPSMCLCPPPMTANEEECMNSCVEAHDTVMYVFEHADTDESWTITAEEANAVNHSSEFHECQQWADHDQNGELEYCEVLECVWWKDEKNHENACMPDHCLCPQEPTCQDTCMHAHDFTYMVMEHAGGEDWMISREEADAQGHADEWDQCASWADVDGDGLLSYCEVLECAYWGDENNANCDPQHCLCPPPIPEDCMDACGSAHDFVWMCMEHGDDNEDWEISRDEADAHGHGEEWDKCSEYTANDNDTLDYCEILDCAWAMEEASAHCDGSFCLCHQQMDDTTTGTA